ncbi:probable RNA methyltransferase CG11342 [Anopheles nili]|uniref:probable RNA methyltransferase CG11342 n=1 Tax=Anopheles nili TaxID=185578 RepID=UPI00237A895E|nr:probable RNA methyltransferase CG11342 [Anopheles nili]
MEESTLIKNGNYHNYYEFRSDDSRSQILRKYLEKLWTAQHYDRLTLKDGSIHMLDIGCNTGQFTAKVRQILTEVTKVGNVRAVGLDLDHKLCERAKRGFPNMEFICGNVMNIAQCDQPGTEDLIKLCLTRMGIQRFDVICCFSVLMYVHLNGGDMGLRKVLDYICANGIFLILELQAWQKYRDHVRRLKRATGQSYPQYAELKWKGGRGMLEKYVKTYIQSKGFKILGESTEKNEFNRQLIFFEKKYIS